MLSYRRIPYWENRRRVERLQTFGRLLAEYEANLEHAGFYGGGGVHENDVAKVKRGELSFILDDVEHIVIAAGLLPEIRWTPPPMVGGYVQNVDLFTNLFMLHQFQIPLQQVADMLNRALGIYERDRTAATRRTFNPLYWLGRVFDAFAAAPFAVARRAGFSTRKIEDTTFGRFVKLFFFVAAGIASILTILQLVGWLDTALIIVGLKPLDLPTLPGVR